MAEDIRDSKIRLSIVAGATDGVKEIQKLLEQIRKDALATQKALQLGISGGTKGAGGVAGPSTASMEAQIAKRGKALRKAGDAEVAIVKETANKKAKTFSALAENQRQRAAADRRRADKERDAAFKEELAFEKRAARALENVRRTSFYGAAPGVSGRVQALRNVRAGLPGGMASMGAVPGRPSVLPRRPAGGGGKPSPGFAGRSGFTSAPEFVAIGGAALAGKAIISAAMDFEKSMATVQAITKATEREFSNLREAALKAASGTVYTAQEVGSAMAELARAGFSTNEVIASIEPTMKLATIAGEDFSQTVTTVTDILRSFNISATETSHVADVMAQASIMSKANVADLGLALSYVSADASKLGMSFEETVAALSMMADAGIRGSKAGTGLRRIIHEFIDPSNTKNLKQLGLSFKDVDVRTLGLVGALDNLRKAGIGNVESLEIFQERGMTPFLSLLKTGGKTLKDYESGLLDVKDAHLKLEKAVTDNLSDALLKLKSAALEPVIRKFKDLHDAATSAAQAATEALQKGGVGGQIAGAGITAGALGLGVVGAGGTAIIAAKGIARVAEALSPIWKTLTTNVTLTSTAMTNANLGIATTSARVITLSGTLGVLKTAAIAAGAVLRTMAPLAIFEGVNILLDKWSDSLDRLADRQAFAGIQATQQMIDDLTASVSKMSNAGDIEKFISQQKDITKNLESDAKEYLHTISQRKQAIEELRKEIEGAPPASLRDTDPEAILRGQKLLKMRAELLELEKDALALTEERALILRKGEAAGPATKAAEDKLKELREAAAAPDPEVMRKQQEAASKLESIWSSTASSIEGSFANAFEEMALDGKKFADAMRDISKDIQRALVRNVSQQMAANITAPIFGNASPGFSPAPGAPGKGAGTLASMWPSVFGSAGPSTAPAGNAPAAPAAPATPATTATAPVVALAPMAYGKHKQNLPVNIKQVGGKPVTTATPSRSQSSGASLMQGVGQMNLGQILGAGVGGMMAFQGMQDIFRGKSGGMAQTVTGGAQIGGSIFGPIGAIGGAAVGGIAGGIAKSIRKTGSAGGVMGAGLRHIGIGGGASLNRKRRRRAKQAAAEMAMMEAERQKERERAATQLQETFGGGLATTEGAAVLGQMLSGGINEAELQALEAGAGDVVGALGGAVGAVQAPQTTVTMNPTFIIRTGLDMQKAAQALGQMIAQSSPYGSIGSP